MLVIATSHITRCQRIGDLHRDEHRRGRQRRQLLLSATQNSPGDTIATRDLGDARVWLRRLFEDPPSILCVLKTSSALIS